VFWAPTFVRTKGLSFGRSSHRTTADDRCGRRMSIRRVDAIRTRSGQKRAFVRGHRISDVPSPYHADVSTLVGGRCQQPISGTVTSLHCVNRAPRSAAPSHGAPARQKAPRWSCLGDATTAGEGGRLALRRKRVPDGARLVGGAHATSLAEVLRPSCRRIWVALLWLFGGGVGRETTAETVGGGGADRRGP